MSKGSKRRQSSVPSEKFNESFDKIFGKKKMTVEQRAWLALSNMDRATRDTNSS